ncbi:MAG: hybrid sensor histidine kinase/response regulator [Luteimonas sp.]
MHDQGDTVSDIAAYQRALRESQAETLRQQRLYEAILGNTPDLAYVFDLQHRFIYANEGLLRMWGKTREEALGHTCLELGYEPWHAAMHDREIDHVAATGEPVRGEVPFTGTFGRRIYDYIFVPVFNADGQVEAVAGTTRDVTEHKRNEDALRHHATMVDSLIESAPVGIYVLDSAMRIRHANPVAFPAFGEFAPDLVGRDLRDVLPALWGQAAGDMAVEVFRRTLETGEPFVVDEFSGVRLDTGATEYYDWRVQRVVLPDGAQGVVCYFRDISAKVSARKAIEESRDALELADARKDEFLATLAHELRNPLAPLSNCLNILRLRGDGDDENRRLHAVMERQLAMLVRMTDDLLEVSRITRGRIELRHAPTDLRDILEAALETSRPLIDAAAHRLELQVEDTPMPLLGDAVRLSQVFANLLNNAAKYTPPGGTIRLGAARDGMQARASVRDSGIGLAPDMLDKVFELFAQDEQGRRLSQGGLGIGLTLVRRLVEMHGGSVEASSRGPGEGSEFIVRLPLRETEQDAPSTRAMPGAEGVPLDILVVDDSRENADSLAQMLAIGGHRVRVAYDGQACLDAIDARMPDLVLLDLGMPAFDGFATCRRIRERHGGAPMVVAVTGWGQARDVARAAEAGFDAHLVKPADPAMLDDVIAACRGASAVSG